MNWHNELLNRGFSVLESTTKTYGNGVFTGSIHEEVFYPFLRGDDERLPNLNYQTIKLKNTEDLDNYILSCNSK